MRAWAITLVLPRSELHFTAALLLAATALSRHQEQQQQQTEGGSMTDIAQAFAAMLDVQDCTQLYQNGTSSSNSSSYSDINSTELDSDSPQSTRCKQLRQLLAFAAHSRLTPSSRQSLTAWGQALHSQQQQVQQQKQSLMTNGNATTSSHLSTLESLEFERFEHWGWRGEWITLTCMLPADALNATSKHEQLQAELIKPRDFGGELWHATLCAGA